MPEGGDSVLDQSVNAAATEPEFRHSKDATTKRAPNKAMQGKPPTPGNQSVMEVKENVTTLGRIVSQDTSLLPSNSTEEVVAIIKNLSFYTMMLILMPVISFYGAKKYIFEDMLGYDSTSSMICWAVLAVVLINVVLGVAVYRSYRDGLKPEKQNGKKLN